MEANTTELSEAEAEFPEGIFESEEDEDAPRLEKVQAGRRLGLVRRFRKKHPLLYKILRKHGIILPGRRAKKQKGIRKYLNTGLAIKVLPLAFTLSPDFCGIGAEGMEVESMMEYTSEAVSEFFSTLGEKISALFGSGAEDEKQEGGKAATLSTTSQTGVLGFLGGLGGKVINIKQVGLDTKKVVFKLGWVQKIINRAI